MVKKAQWDKLQQWRFKNKEHYAGTIMDPPVHLTFNQAIPDKGSIIVMGHRRRGKTGLAHAIGEHGYRKGKAVVLHLPTANKEAAAKIKKLIPEWMIITSDRSQWPNNAVIIYDEASQTAHARRSQTGSAVEMDEILGISGQRNQLIVFISHHSRKLDLNIVTEADLILWKQPTYAHCLFERDELSDFVYKAFHFFQNLKTNSEQLRTTLGMDFQNFRFTEFTNGLPAYWTQELSCLFENIKQKSKNNNIVR